jgi:hypothetical protein
MKKQTDKARQRRKLILHRETITALTPPQLREVVGGWTQDWPCGSEQTQSGAECTGNPR